MIFQPSVSTVLKITLSLLPVLAVFLIIAYGIQNDRTELGRNILFYTIIFFSCLGFISLFFWTRYVYGIRQSDHNELASQLPFVIDDGYVITREDGLIEYTTPFFQNLINIDGEQKQNINNICNGDGIAGKKIYKLLNTARRGRTQNDSILLKTATQDEKMNFNVSVKPYNGNNNPSKLVLWKFQPHKDESPFERNGISLLQQAIDNLDKAPIGLFSCNHSGQLNYANVTFAKMAQFDLAAPDGDLPNLRFIFERKDIKQLLTTHMSDSPRDFLRLETQTIPHNRSYQAARLTIITRPLAFGGIRHFIAIDTNWLKKQAKESENDYFEKAPLAIARVDSSGKIIEVNQKFCSLVKISRQNVNRSNIGDFLEKKAKSELKKTIDKMYRQNLETGIIELDFVNKIKKTAHCQLLPKSESENLKTTEKQDDTNILIYLGYAKEEQPQITDEHQAQSQKMQAIGQLAGGIAHDFNNVLTAITGAADILMTNMQPSSKQFHEVVQIRSNANRAANLVHHLMAFSRKQKLKFTITSFSEVINSDLCNLIRRLIATAKIELNINLARDIWPVKADINQLEQVIVNLAVNSRDAMPNGGKLAVKAYNVTHEESKQLGDGNIPAAEYVCLEIRDTGVGIPKEVIDNVFEPFFTTKETGKGTGMGLATVYGIIKQSEGFLLLHSQVGKGTVFSIYLPRNLATTTTRENKAKEKLDLAKSDTKKKKHIDDYTGAMERILLVEDEDSVRSVTTKALTQQGYIVTEALNGADALKIIEKGEKFDIIISDVLMPGMDGPTLIEKIRKKIGIIPTIFISGYADDALESNLDANSYTYLPKPFGIKQLIKTVKDTLRN